MIIDLLFLEPKAFAVPVIKRDPKHCWYETGGSVELICHVEKVTNQYRFEWSKVGSDKCSKTDKKLVESNKLRLKSLSEDDTGTYKCTLSRFAVRYTIYKTVNISVKGNV